MSYHPTVRAAALSLSFVLATTALQAQRPATATRTLTGSVRSLDTGEGIAAARITATGTSLGTTTDEHGHFALGGLPARRQPIRISAIGYHPITDTIDLQTTDREVIVRLRAVVVELAGLETTARARTTPAQASTLIGADELAQRRGQTLARSLEQVPGVAVIQYGPSIAKPVVRGLHSARIRIMNGTVPQEGQQWGAEHAPEIDGFAANEIEVIRGAAGILYGSAAMGGVVRVVPRPLPIGHGVAGELQVNGFSNNRQGAASLRLEGGGVDLPLLADLSWRAQATLRGAGDARTPAYYLPNTGFTEADWHVAAGIHRGWGRAGLAFSHFGTTLGQYTGAHIGTVDDLERAMADPIVAETFSRTITRPSQEISHNLLTATGTVRLGTATSLDLTYGYQYNNRNEYDSRGFAAATPRPAFGLRLITHSVEAKLHHRLSDQVRGTVGLVGLRQGNLSRGRSFLIPQYRLYSTGIFALEQYTTGALTVSAGLRHDTRWQHAFQYGAPVIISPDDIRSWAGLSGSLGASLDLGGGWSIASSVSRMWRPANINERFSRGVHHGTAQYEIGDTALDREQTLAVDLTLRHVDDRMRLELTAYRNAIDDFIYLRPRDPVQTVRGAYPAYQYMATDARMLGGEASIQYEPTDQLMLHASGTLVRGTDRSDETPLYDMPADRLRALVRWHGEGGDRMAGPYIELGTTLVRHQARVPPSLVHPLPGDGYALLSLGIGAARVQLLGHGVELGLDVRNLLDTTHRDYLSRYRLFVDDPGRDIVLRMRTTFGTLPI
ncbi:MAG TPA: TonB-dependent receptor [Gemmatimonadales bacterium]|nr:TonB-dependent receptor [Gemmatimonadales bacterium]